MSKLFKRLGALSIIFTLIMAFESFAGVTVSKQDVATTSKTVTWTADDASAEMRWASGSLSAADFDSATVAGTGSATIEIDENGNYTFFSKSGDNVIADTITITNIDNVSPDITVTNLVVNTNGTMDVYYDASDYFSSCETRYKSGDCSASEWGSATPMSGGLLSALPNGTYTLFAKDQAGNVGTYLLHSDSSSSQTETSESKEWETSESWEYQTYGASGELSYPERTVSVVISKCDSDTGKQVAGAKLQLKNAETGEVIEEWTTSECDRVFHGLSDTTKYVLTELYAPNGYNKAEAIEFYPKNLDSYTLVMYDKQKTKIPSNGGSSGGGGGPSGGGSEWYVSISKQDITNKAELPGAELIITKEDGSVFEKWTSASTPHLIRNMPNGNYTLTEVTAPNGYNVAESISFTIKDYKLSDGSTEIVMYDAHDGTPVETTTPAPTPPTTQEAPPKLPQTGGFDNMAMIVLGACIMCLVGGSGYVWSKKKMKKQ